MAEQVPPGGTMFHRKMISIPVEEHDRLMAIKERAESEASLTMSKTAAAPVVVEARRKAAQYILTGSYDAD